VSIGKIATLNGLLGTFELVLLGGLGSAYTRHH